MRVVRVRVQFWNLQNVNTVQQRFDATVWIQLRWTVDRPLANVSLEKEWVPELTLLDHIGELRKERSLYKRSTTGDLGKTWIYLRYIFQGTFPETFALQTFPFDTQHLPVRGVFWKCTPDEVQLVKGACDIYHEAFVQADAWRLEPEVQIVSGRTPAHRNGYGIQHALVCTYVTLHRSSMFYLWNMVLPLCMIVSLSCSSFLLRDLAERTNLVVTLLLTLIAFKWGTMQYLPTMSYLTLLDIYMLVCLAFLVWVYCAHLLIVSAPLETQVWVGAWTTGAWALFHVYAAMYVGWRRTRTRSRPRLPFMDTVL